MRRILSAVIVFSLLASCSSSKHSRSRRLPGVWQAQPITIDGRNTDWPSPYPEYDSKAMLGYAVSNDKDNIYITVETGDMATALKILREGLTVWIDRKGDGDEVTAINYPVPYNSGKDGVKDVDRPQGGRMQPGQGGSAEERKRNELEDRVRKALENNMEYSLQGFKACNLQFPLMEKDSCGIIVSMSLDADNEFVWEAVVPLRTFYFKPEITRADKGKALTVCFETVGMKRPPGSGNSGSHSGGGMRPSVGFGGFGGMGMGMGMRTGGGRGGSRNSSQGTDNVMEPLYRSTKTLKKFGLAWQDGAK